MARRWIPWLFWSLALVSSTCVAGWFRLRYPASGAVGLVLLLVIPLVFAASGAILANGWRGLLPMFRDKEHPSTAE